MRRAKRVAQVIEKALRGEIRLRDVIAASEIPVEDAVGIIQCVSSAVAAVHSTGVAHQTSISGTGTAGSVRSGCTSPQ